MQLTSKFLQILGELFCVGLTLCAVAEFPAQLQFP
jgi:hypothetical protein